MNKKCINTFECLTCDCLKFQHTCTIVLQLKFKMYILCKTHCTVGLGCGLEVIRQLDKLKQWELMESQSVDPKKRQKLFHQWAASSYKLDKPCLNQSHGQIQNHKNTTRKQFCDLQIFFKSSKSTLMWSNHEDGPVF